MSQEIKFEYERVNRDFKPTNSSHYGLDLVKLLEELELLDVIEFA